MEDKNMYDIQQKLMELVNDGKIKPMDGKIMLLNCEAGYFQALNEIDALMNGHTEEEVLSGLDTMRKVCKLRTKLIMEDKYGTLKNVLNDIQDAFNESDGTDTPEK